MMRLTAEDFTTEDTIFHLSFDICHWSLVSRIEFDHQLNAEVFAEVRRVFKDEG